MKNLIILTALLIPLFVHSMEGEISTDTEANASAKIVAKSFVYEYETDYEMALHYDQCDKADVSQGWIAKVKQISTGKNATGCWTKVVQLVNHEPVEWVFVIIEDGTDKFEFRFKAKSFTPRF